jgi:hypothetical protein
MALIGRILVVLFALLFASGAATIVATTGMLLPYDWQNLSSVDIHGGLFTMVAGVGFVFISTLAFLPAVAVIAVAEAFRIRSALFYAAAGALDGVWVFYRSGLTEGMSNDPLLTRITEIMAASGIAAGLLYWAMAGRNAGRWSERQTPAAPPPA